MIDTTKYTDALPTKNGWYWCFHKDHPEPGCFFLQQNCGVNYEWKLYSCGGYANGHTWIQGHYYRSLEPLTAPRAYVDEHA